LVSAGKKNSTGSFFTKYLKKRDEKVEHSVALRNTNVSAKQFDDAITTLVARDEVTRDKIEYMNKQGKLCGKQAYVWMGRKE